MKIKQAHKLNGEITVPGDKSISHRSIMFSAIILDRCRLFDLH